jgi:cyclic beta-1,2-glucan synthetase
LKDDSNVLLDAYQDTVEAMGEGRAHAAKLNSALATEAWDGAWYLRGFYDDGTPLGSSQSEECRIDSIAQSWSVLSGASGSVRSRTAMDALEESLIKWTEGLALLFAPPFDKTAREPGYIKGYPPGIRENGGQYTHAAAWTVMAMAELGEGKKAFELFSMLNPINHARRRSDVLRYKVEPYAVAADVYATPPHVGRGGWTWYTGSAGWMQQAGVEAVLGLEERGAFLHLWPCIPAEWPSYKLTYRYRSTTYEIWVENEARVMCGITELVMDGVSYPTQTPRLPLQDDGKLHHVNVRLGNQIPADGRSPSSA